MEGEFRQLGIPVEILEYPGLSFHPARAIPLLRSTARFFKDFVRILDRHRVDVIHAYLPGGNVLAMAASMFCRPRLRVVSKRALCQYKAGHPLFSFVEDLANLAADAVLVNSRAVGEDVSLSERFVDGKIFLVHNGVDAEAFAGGSPMDGLRTEAGAQGAVLCVANFFPYKGHLDLVDAARIVVDAEPSTRFLLVGSDGGALSSVRERVGDLSLGAHVELSGFSRDVPRLLGDAAFVVLPSHEEGFPNVILEAMAAGKAVVATRVGGIPEAVEDGVTGLLVPPANPEYLASAILTLREDPARAEAMGRAGRERVRTRFSLDAMVGRMQTSYLELLERKGPDRPIPLPARLLLFAGSFLLIALTSRLFWFPTLNCDGGYYLRLAREVANGRVPFLDFEIIYPPGTFYLQNVFDFIHGGSPAAVAAQDMLLNLGAAFGLYVCARRLLGADRSVALLLSSLFIVIFPAFDGSYMVLEPHSSFWGWLALVVVIGVRRTGPDRDGGGDPGLFRVTLAGALAGLSMMVKQPGAVFLVAGWAIAARDATWPRRLRLGAAMAGAAVSFWILFFVLHPGAVLPAWDQNVILLSRYAARSRSATGYTLAELGGLMWQNRWIVLPILAAGVTSAWYCRRGEARHSDSTLLILMGAGLALVLPALSRPWRHYLLYPIPFALLGGAYVLTRPRRPVGIALVTLILASSAAWRLPREIADWQLNTLPAVHARQEVLRKWIAGRAGGRKVILVAPSESQFYFLGGYEPPSPNFEFYAGTEQVLAAARVQAPVFLVQPFEREKADLVKTLRNVGYRRTDNLGEEAEVWLPDPAPTPGLPDAPHPGPV
jgi:L-malate glycosyltransferase